MTTIACLGASSLSLRNVILIPGSESWREEWNLSMASFGATSSTLLSLSALIFQPTSKDAQQPVNCAHGYRDRKRSRCPACTSRPFSLTHPVSLMADTVLNDTVSQHALGSQPAQLPQTKSVKHHRGFVRCLARPSRSARPMRCGATVPPCKLRTNLKPKGFFSKMTSTALRLAASEDTTALRTYSVPGVT